MQQDDLFVHPRAACSARGSAIQAHQRELFVPTDGRVTTDDNLAITLQHDRVCDRRVAELHDDDAGGAEARVERAAPSVAKHGDLAAGPGGGRVDAGYDD